MSDNYQALSWHLTLYIFLYKIWKSCLTIFSCDQAALWMVQSVRFIQHVSCCINFAIISNGFTSPFGKKEKKNCHLYNTILSLYISYQVSTYHIKTLQEESAKKSNIPWIWRIIYGHKLPYMKKTKITLYEEDKKEEASMRCSLLHGSWDQILRRRPSVCLSVCLSHLFHHVPIIVSSWNFQELLPMRKVTSMQKVKIRGQRSRSQRSTPNLIVSGL